MQSGLDGLDFSSDFQFLQFFLSLYGPFQMYQLQMV